MKKILLFAILSVFIFSSYTMAADTKISGLTADTAPTEDDLVPTVDAPAGTPANKKVTVANLFKNRVISAPQIVITTTGLTQDKVYYRTSEFAWAEADGNGTGTYPALCYAISTTQCMIQGVYTKATHGFAAGPLYLSDDAGDVSSTVGTKVQSIGYAYDANTIIIRVSPDYAE